MSKELLWVLLAVLLGGVSAVSCGDDDGAADAGAGAQKGPGEFMADFESSQQFFTQMSGFREGTSPHGNTWIWYSSDLKTLVEKDSFTANEGSVSIKKFDNDGTEGPDGLAVMVKKPAGYDAANGDWEYEMRSTDGTVMNGEDGAPLQGKIPMCIGCHANFKATDYLAGTKLR